MVIYRPVETRVFCRTNSAGLRIWWSDEISWRPVLYARCQISRRESEKVCLQPGEGWRTFHYGDAEGRFDSSFFLFFFYIILNPFFSFSCFRSMMIKITGNCYLVLEHDHLLPADWTIAAAKKMNRHDAEWTLEISMDSLKEEKIWRFLKKKTTKYSCKFFSKIFKFSLSSPCYTLGGTLWQEEFKTVKIIQIGHL